MVRFVVFFLILATYNLLCFPQKNGNDTVNLEIISALESLPIYKGGLNKLNRFIEENINYPKNALRDSLEGIVYISMDVDTEGNTHNHIIIKGVRDDLDNEALRVTKLIKFEKPAMQHGKSIKVRYTVPVEFKLSEKSELRKKGCKK